ncbi:DNA-directed RNA polymerase II subunit RPB1 [Lasiodiplodia theobromae]|uniref:DNA-directed RNA polymerase II subunit RPB1 n=1 Tax=Lasiodiplodia theobromae TaxID=45133 RepID=A0A5N5D638_9PEZI|nr:DNA-directed RNA polymerase II subunit RPB1 [Lasiodiplodia theobromae]
MPILSAEEIIKYGRRLSEDMDFLREAIEHNWNQPGNELPVFEEYYTMIADLYRDKIKLDRHLENLKIAYNGNAESGNEKDNVGDNSSTTLTEEEVQQHNKPDSPQNEPTIPDYRPPSPRYVPTSPKYTPPKQDKLPAIFLDDTDDKVQYLGSRKRKRTEEMTENDNSNKRNSALRRRLA